MKLLVKRLGHMPRAPVLRLHPRPREAASRISARRSQTGLDDREGTCAASTAGFNTPTFVVDAPGGGGKRVAHSFEHYDRTTGISVYAAPSVKPGFFLYFDPVDTLAPEVAERWKDPAEQDRMVKAAIDAARVSQAASARASSVR